ncbi:MAG: hypothetical protein H0V94_04740 [Actinobacteria bacterium]|nr:hypothetical protein [Actinomycetota bacterium]
MAGWISIALETARRSPILAPCGAERAVRRAVAALAARRARPAGARRGNELNQFAAAALAGAVGWRAR